MIIHRSHHEEDLGWIPISKQLPDFNKEVKTACIHIFDWNLEFLIWETIGKIRKTDANKKGFVWINKYKE